MSYQQDALRRLTCNRSAASLVGASSGSGGTAGSAAVSGEARRSRHTNHSIHRSNSATTSNRPFAMAATSSNVDVEEETQGERNEANIGEVRWDIFNSLVCQLFINACPL